MNVLKRGDTNIWLFLFVNSFGKLLFSVSRLWKISLFDCQVLWVQYKSTSMIYKRTIIGINFWNENAKKNPMFLKKELKILWRGNRSFIHYLTPKICRSTLLASIGKIYTLRSIFTRLLVVSLGRCPLRPPCYILHNGKMIVPQTA